MLNWEKIDKYITVIAFLDTLQIKALKNTKKFSETLLEPKWTTEGIKEVANTTGLKCIVVDNSKLTITTKPPSQTGEVLKPVYQI